MPFDGDAMMQLLDMAADVRDEIAQEIIDGASPPVDTGFLEASAYIMSDRTNTFDDGWETGTYPSTKTGLDAYRERISEPELPPDSNTAIIGWSAVYAWYVEDNTNFIFGALMSRAEGGTASEGTGSGQTANASTGGGWWQSTKAAASNAASNAWNATKTTASNAWNATKTAASSAWSAVTGFFRR